jgi:hypothetical protein
LSQALRKCTKMHGPEPTEKCEELAQHIHDCKENRGLHPPPPALVWQTRSQGHSVPHQTQRPFLASTRPIPPQFDFLPLARPLLMVQDGLIVERMPVNLEQVAVVVTEGSASVLSDAGPGGSGRASRSVLVSLMSHSIETCTSWSSPGSRQFLSLRGITLSPAHVDAEE